MTAAAGRDSGAADADSFTERLFWEPHASPQSVWLLVATYPVLVLALYRRSRSLAAAILLAVAVSLRAVSPPESDAAWATRVVRGEQLWLDRGLASDPRGLALLVLGAVVHVSTFRSAFRRDRTRTLVGTVASMGTMGLFFGRMVETYERHGSDRTPR